MNVRAEAGRRLPKSTVQDDLVMATNNSSIVSKRSVERLYYPDEPHFFRFFVKKPQRRSPLINRGYLLRMRAVDVLVRDFLGEPTSKTKVVVNLGCGSDVLPWQCHTRYPESCVNARFIDVDYPDLMTKKRDIVLGTPELCNLMGSFEAADGSPILISSARYCQVGCDLRDLQALEQCFTSLVDIASCSFLFVAEVSITYMATPDADALIQWASTIGDAKFCLLEQILPHGPDHLFASTMLKHFEKLNTPLKSVNTYPNLSDQETRFLSRGWLSCQSWTLWDAWADSRFLASTDRKTMDAVEPFDEWEELALFSSHYFILLAGNCEMHQRPRPSEKLPSHTSRKARVSMGFHPYPSTRSYRRFGGAFIHEGPLGEEYMNHIMGHGAKARLKSWDTYQLGHQLSDPSAFATTPSARLCFPITDLGQAGILLCGGRLSPSLALRDSWLLKRGSNQWQQVADLPLPLFRHAVARLGHSSLAILAGGKSNSTDVSGDYFVFRPDKGWMRCDITGQVPIPTFGALLLVGNSARADFGSFHGIVAGGLAEDGIVCERVYRWKLQVGKFDREQRPSIFFQEIDLGDPTAAELKTLCRFGALSTPCSDKHVIAGGVPEEEHLPGEETILVIKVTEATVGIETLVSSAEKLPPASFVGGNLIASRGGQITVIGGGATCFSMGTFWTPGVYTFRLEGGSRSEDTIHSSPPSLLFHHKTTEPRLPKLASFAGANSDDGPASLTQVPRIKLVTGEDLDRLINSKEPAVIEELKLGPCVGRWDLNYLANIVGRDRKVVVHECPSEKMDFVGKNFHYVTKGFGDFLGEVQSGAHLYLRSLSLDEPSNRPANIRDDFPALSNDFILPSELATVSANEFSSVLRISGRVNMWLHYDVMANIYCQIGGSKRLVLFPPGDVTSFAFEPGASSSSVDVFSLLEGGDPLLRSTRPHEARLEPGDVLFLPPFWLHTATPTSDASVAVNVFFRDLESGYANGRDVYGNKDLAAYEKGRLDLRRLASYFNKLPLDAREFYLKRLADELLVAARR